MIAKYTLNFMFKALPFRSIARMYSTKRYLSNPTPAIRLNKYGFCTDKEKP